MYNSISDQYLVQAGIAHPISVVRGLTLTIGPRWEGVPAKDLIGDSLGSGGQVTLSRSSPAFNTCTK